MSGRQPALAPLPWRYADHVSWERRALAGGALAAQLEHWRQRLAGLAPLELPLDRARPAVQSHRGAGRRFVLEPRLVGELTALARECGATLFAALLAGFAALLARYSGQEDLAVGVPVAGRRRAESEGMIGLFVNTLVMRLGLGGAPSFRDLVQRARDTASSAQEHQDVPFEKLVEELHPERTGGVTPLFQVLFAFLSATAAAPASMGGVRLEAVEEEVTSTRFDLSCAVHQRGERVSGWFEHATALFDRTTIARMQGHWLALLRRGRGGAGIAGAGAAAARRRREASAVGGVECGCRGPGGRSDADRSAGGPRCGSRRTAWPWSAETRGSATAACGAGRPVWRHVSRRSASVPRTEWVCWRTAHRRRWWRCSACGRREPRGCRSIRRCRKPG